MVRESQHCFGWCAYIQHEGDFAQRRRCKKVAEHLLERLLKSRETAIPRDDAMNPHYADRSADLPDARHEAVERLDLSETERCLAQDGVEDAVSLGVDLFVRSEQIGRELLRAFVRPAHHAYLETVAADCSDPRTASVLVVVKAEVVDLVPEFAWQT